MQSSHESLPEFAASTIIVADDIFPSTVLQLNTQQVRGICLREGSGKSHGAIIARHAGIAFLSQQGEALDTIPTGAHLILDITGQRATLA
jgi:PTS hybrid protein